jgi:hypothetical protein
VVAASSFAGFAIGFVLGGFVFGFTVIAAVMKSTSRARSASTFHSRLASAPEIEHVLMVVAGTTIGQRWV